jgi:hypothetical protein
VGPDYLTIGASGGPGLLDHCQRQSIQLSDPVPDLEDFGSDVNMHLFADQTAGQRVGVATDMDRAPGIDPGLEPASHLQPTSRRRRQHGHFLTRTLLSSGITSGHELLEERLAVASTGEIAAPTKHQGLVDSLLETVMTLLDVAILVGLPRLDRLAFEPVMREQSLVSASEHSDSGSLLTAAVKRSVRCRRGTPPSSHKAFCRPSLRLSKLSEKQTVPASQLE